MNSLSLASSPGERTVFGFVASSFSGEGVSTDEEPGRHVPHRHAKVSVIPADRKKERASLIFQPLVFPKAEVGVQSGLELIREFLSRDAGGLIHRPGRHYALRVGCRTEVGQRRVRDCPGPVPPPGLEPPPPPPFEPERFDWSSSSMASVSAPMAFGRCPAYREYCASRPSPRRRF
jgi:hypothetical protein